MQTNLNFWWAVILMLLLIMMILKLLLMSPLPIVPSLLLMKMVTLYIVRAVALTKPCSKLLRLHNLQRKLFRGNLDLDQRALVWRRLAHLQQRALHRTLDARVVREDGARGVPERRGLELCRGRADVAGMDEGVVVSVAGAQDWLVMVVAAHCCGCCCARPGERRGHGVGVSCNWLWGL